MIDVDGKEYTEKADRSQVSIHITSPNLLLLRLFQDHFGGKLRRPSRGDGRTRYALWFHNDRRRVLLQRLATHRLPEDVEQWMDADREAWVRGAVAIKMTFGEERACMTATAPHIALIRDVLQKIFPDTALRGDSLRIRLNAKRDREALQKWAFEYVIADNLTAAGANRWNVSTDEEEQLAAANALADRRMMVDINKLRLQESEATKTPCPSHTPYLTPILVNRIRDELQHCDLNRRRKPYKVIAEATGTTVNQVARIAKQEGLRRGPGGEVLHKSAAMREYARPMAERGVKAMDMLTLIRQQFETSDISLSTVKRWRKQFLNARQHDGTTSSE